MQKGTKVLILGADGYLGKALSLYLKDRYEVYGIDNGLREKNVRSIGGNSVIPVTFSSPYLDITNYEDLKNLISVFQPDAIIHFAEQPSAPFSMRSAKNAGDTQHNNIIGTLNLLHAVHEVNPDIHIIKLGTAGEYPDWLYKDIVVPEDTRITVQYQDKDWTIPTPRYAGSWYHFSKLHDSMNIDYACKIWGLKVTDLNQGIVYGHVNGTRFDHDYYFGTVINRFVAQKLANVPYTVYGTGGQMRAFINIKNVLQAIELVIHNPPEGYRIIHQLTETHTVREIAEVLGGEINYLENPRVELPENTIKFEAKTLQSFGLKPVDFEDELENLIEQIEPYKLNINPEVIKPTTTWKG